MKPVELQDYLAISTSKLDEVEQLDEALKLLEKENPRQAKGGGVAVLRRTVGGADPVFIKMSPRSVKRDWALARIWLYRQLKQDGKALPEAEK